MRNSKSMKKYSIAIMALIIGYAHAILISNKLQGSVTTEVEQEDYDN